MALQVGKVPVAFTSLQHCLCILPAELKSEEEKHNQHLDCKTSVCLNTHTHTVSKQTVTQTSSLPSAVTLKQKHTSGVRSTKHEAEVISLPQCLVVDA